MSPGCAAYSTEATLSDRRDGSAEDLRLGAYPGVDSIPFRFRALERRRFLGFEVPVATTWLSRLLGLALLPRESAGTGLLIPGCRSVHTVGMRFRLDLLFLNRDGEIIELCRDVPGWRFLRCRRAAAVLELPSP
jgi:uncharacterized protein